jgi:hypothetical protein
LIASTGAVLGPAFSPKRIRAFNRQGGTITVGESGAFDIQLTEAETTNWIQGDPASVWANIRKLQTGDDLNGFALVLDSASVADNTKGVWWMWGKDVVGEVNVTVDGSVTQNVSLGDATDVLVSPCPEAAAAPLRKIVGIIPDTNPTPTGASNRTLRIFDGWHGIG